MESSDFSKYFPEFVSGMLLAAVLDSIEKEEEKPLAKPEKTNADKEFDEMKKNINTLFSAISDLAIRVSKLESKN